MAIAPPTPGQLASTPISQLSLLEKLDLFPGVLSVLGTAFYTAATGPFRGESGAYTYGQHLSAAIIRKLVKRLSTRQLQYIGEPFSKIYEKWARSNGIQPEFVTLKSGCKAFWMGDKEKAKHIVVYFHGGGFSLDGDDIHLKFWHGVQKALEEGGEHVAFFFLEYTLVPHATYPTQIVQAVEAVNYVRTELQRPASDIILGGDSAGGNMCLAVLSHAMHPNNELPDLAFGEGDKFKAIVLVAPWTTFRVDWPSSERCKYKDIVSTYAAQMWSNDYMAGRPQTPYAEALEASADWWKDPRVEHVLCVAGGDEMLIDSIDAWVEKYKSVNPDGITYVVGAHENHIEPITNTRWSTAETEQGKAIKSWLKAKL
ncbi:hypothetical protein PV08_06526 [Exophiala spinifera]|uniref:Alpha/beta hydrolase fold-3 domain-containing protein n=1 Tax=Exophiala spinifera TaxID=91928 RepID=A0A0D1ZUQ3_9EURO|nr:uncharacterized protein PV08_06526 [Exophiala spinifera]KIW16472.1 hypothetical protein PV08_06526 [Exophiala spinifera]